ncbi:MAG: ribosomal-processing cysteine protease Prp [Clostridia bacterium]|nr:ribosomal-processing cysteine protease Prp [Clostridia bacterium]
MIRAEFFADAEGRVLGFSITGHAGMAEAGSDILCAAVSSAAYMTANTVLEVLRITPVSLRVEEGDMLFRIAERDEKPCRTVFSGFKLHLLGLEEQYPDHLRVRYTEV